MCVSCFRLTLYAIEPSQRVFQCLRISENKLIYNNRIYILNNNVHIAAFGKAALGMVKGAYMAFSDHIVEGIASIPRNTMSSSSQITNYKTEFYEGATNNLPDLDAYNNAQRIELMAQRLTENDIFLVLISGGGSALLPSPVNSISLDDKLSTIKLMTSHGADIKQLNTVRKRLSKLKGGKLAMIAHPAKVISVIISDVVGDPIDLIASGPTVITQNISNGDNDPIKILTKLGAWNSVPSSVKDVLMNHPSDIDLNQKVDVNNNIISNNMDALVQLSKELGKYGYHSHIVSSTVSDDARIYGQKLASFIVSVLKGNTISYSLANSNIPNSISEFIDTDRVALLFGGECTAKVKGNGKGGRNQEIILSALIKLVEEDIRLNKFEFALLSGGTDGQDGPTDAAGAVITSDDVKYLYSNENMGKEIIENYLNNNDSYNFWKNYCNGKCHIKIGPTGTNVMDIQLVLFYSRSP